jgi:type IV secretory pathway VirB9-like protein
MRKEFAFVCLLGTAQLFAADVATPASGAAVAQESRTIAVHAKDVIPVNTQIRETTLIVLPQQEKVMTVYCGDKDNWVIDGTENFVTVKPAKVGARTDVHILTDHGNAYTLSFSEVSNVPGAISDVKLFLQPADDGSRVRLRQQPVFVDAKIAERYKQEAAAAEARAAAAQKEAQQKASAEAEQFRASYPAKLQFDYSFDQKAAAKAPFKVAAIYRDDKFTYIRANPQEVPALYEVKEGKPSLINYNFANGLYTVPKILGAGYLAIGKQKMSFQRVAGTN